jgi:cell division septal protein FtsQ
VRIYLGERKKKKRRRRKRSRTFDTAIAQPQLRPRRRKKRREPSRQSRKKAETARIQWDISWRTVLHRLPAALVLASLVGAIIYVSADAKFFVYQAEIAGARHLDADTIYRAAKVHEQNIFWIEPAKVAERIIHLDGIKAVRVRCSLPARVFIEVEEREPVVMWRVLAQERDWWLDKNSMVLPYPGDDKSPHMVFVVDSSGRQLQEGDRLEPADLVRSVLQLAAALPNTRVFYYDADRGLSFTQQAEGRQWPVYVGTSEDLTRKIQALQVLSQHLEAESIHPTYVDVRWADHPVYHLAEGTAVGKSE